MRSRLHRVRLDHELADGADPESSPELAVRAERLGSHEMRLRIASGLNDALSRSRASRRLTAAAPLGAGAIEANRSALEAVVAELDHGDECDPQGVALAHELLTDAGSPLYAPERPERLSSDLALISRHLRSQR